MEFFKKIRRKNKNISFHEVLQELRWLYKYITRYRATIIVHIFLGILAIFMGFASSIASKYLIDAVTGYKSEVIALAASVMLIMILGNIVMKSVAARIGAILNIRVQNEIQAEIYEHVIAADWESLESFRSGDLLNRLTGDVNTVAGGVTSFIPNLISKSVQFLGALAIVLYYDPTMAGIALLSIPVSVLSSNFLLKKMRQYNQKMKALSSDIMSFYEDSIADITSIKSFGITDVFMQKMLHLQKEYRTQYLTYNRFSVNTSAFLSLVGIIVSASCFGWGVYRLWSGVITYGSMTLFLQLASTLSASFSALIGLVSSSVSISTSAGRVMAITQLATERQEKSIHFEKSEPVSLEMAQVCFSYKDGSRILHNVDFAANHGELIALTGPSGEGKTTMLRIMLGLIQPQNGSAVLRYGAEQIPLSAATRGAFAYVPQGNSLFWGTIEDNLRLVNPRATEAEIIKALKAACAYDFVQQLPSGLKHKVGGREKGLSEGQAQRLAVARALLRGAPILLLDEATSALDAETEQNMLRNLMNSGLVHTCILVTHRSAALAYCTRQYHVQDGEVKVQCLN